LLPPSWECRLSRSRGRRSLTYPRSARLLLSNRPTGHGAKKMKKNRRSFEVLGPAPPGFDCALCSQDGSELQILHRRHISLWHRDCAEEFFRAPVVEPTEPKFMAVSDRRLPYRGDGLPVKQPQGRVARAGGSLFCAQVRPFADPGSNSSRAQIIQYFELIEGRRWQSYGRT